MWEGQDFGHRISGYQRYPTGFTGLQATRTACLYRGITFELPEILRQYLWCAPRVWVCSPTRPMVVSLSAVWIGDVEIPSELVAAPS